jgi:hypothetical protein
MLWLECWCRVHLSLLMLLSMVFQYSIVGKAAIKVLNNILFIWMSVVVVVTCRSSSWNVTN